MKIIARGKFIIFALIIILMFVSAGTIFCINNTEICNCFLISFSNDFKEVERNLFVSKDTPVSVKDSLLSVLKKADKRVSDFWESEKRVGNPIIIFCNSEKLFASYSESKSILTYKTPLNCFIVIGKDFVDIDMISHELFHTELCARVGYFKTNRKIPTWLDEGLAMQVDYRKKYSEEQYFVLKDSLGKDVQLSEISTPELFYTGDVYFHYLLAKHQVCIWLKEIGKEGFQKFIGNL